MYDAEYWEAGRGAEELADFREVLSRYRWRMEISLEEGGGVETWFPPEEHRQSVSGISLLAKYNGLWSTIGSNGNEIVDVRPESLDTYLWDIQSEHELSRLEPKR